ncbi:hypothetical protein QOT17_003340 [Balamuthia mandrillaris]
MPMCLQGTPPPHFCSPSFNFRYKAKKLQGTSPTPFSSLSLSPSLFPLCSIIYVSQETSRYVPYPFSVSLSLSLSLYLSLFPSSFHRLCMPSHYDYKPDKYSAAADMTSHRENKVLLHPTLPLARCRNNCLRYDPAPALRQAGQLPSPSAQQLPTTYDLRPRRNNYQLLFGLPASTYQRPTEKVIEPKGNFHQNDDMNPLQLQTTRVRSTPATLTTTPEAEPSLRNSKQTSRRSPPT